MKNQPMFKSFKKTAEVSQMHLEKTEPAKLSKKITKSGNLKKIATNFLLTTFKMIDVF